MSDASTAEGGIDNFGAFSSLERCAVVDSRFSSRKEILGTLNATSLFENVIVPQSLEDALEALEEGDFDACILGPSLTKEASLSFIETAKQLPQSRNCAFIAIVEDIKETVDELSESGAHAVLRTPYPKLALAEKVSQAVIAANNWNEDSPKVKNAQGFLGYLDTHRVELSEKIDGELAVIGASKEEYQPETTIVQNDSYQSPGLESISDPLESIRELVRKLKAVKGDSPKVSQFLDYVNESVEQWMLDRMNVSEDEATLLLRERILTYQRKQKRDSLY